MLTGRPILDSKNPAFLYINGNEESGMAESLLHKHNIPIHIVNGCLDEGYAYPLLQYYPWELEGLAEIRRFLATTTQ